MVIALLVCLAAMLVTGLMAYGEQGNPLAAALVTDVNINGSEAGFTTILPKRPDRELRDYARCFLVAAVRACIGYTPSRVSSAACSKSSNAVRA